MLTGVAQGGFVSHGRPLFVEGEPTWFVWLRGHPRAVARHEWQTCVLAPGRGCCEEALEACKKSGLKDLGALKKVIKELSTSATAQAQQPLDMDALWAEAEDDTTTQPSPKPDNAADAVPDTKREAVVTDTKRTGKAHDPDV